MEKNEKKEFKILMIEDNEYKRDKAFRAIGEVSKELNVLTEITVVSYYKAFSSDFFMKQLNNYNGFIVDMQFPINNNGQIERECGIKVLFDLKFNSIVSPVCVFSSSKDTEELIRSKGYTEAQFIQFDPSISIKGDFKKFLENIIKMDEAKGTKGEEDVK